MQESDDCDYRREDFLKQMDGAKTGTQLRVGLIILGIILSFGFNDFAPFGLLMFSWYYEGGLFIRATDIAHLYLYEDSQKSEQITKYLKLRTVLRVIVVLIAFVLAVNMAGEEAATGLMFLLLFAYEFSYSMKIREQLALQFIR